MKNVLVFDSGVGGLSVVAELRRLMPDLFIHYAADDAFRPYGNKTEAQLISRLPRLIQTLVLMTNPDAVVLACNTASTTALVDIRKNVSVPVIGVVPAVKPAAAMSKSKTIAILGTPGTVARKYVGELIGSFAKDCRMILHGSTALVELAEQKLAGQAFNTVKLQAEIMPIFAHEFGKDVDVIVLACTHFPLLRDELQRAAPHKVKWIDSGQAIAKRTQMILAKIENSSPSYPQTAFLIGGQSNEARANMFAKYGFEKTVIL